MNNSIEQLSVAELLDGRYFFIPAYQRGYRWTEEQVGDLLRDLLTFVYEKQSEDDFYCLQPVIVRPITNPERIRTIFGEDMVEEVIKRKAWELVDGQQRFTSLYIIYKYLLDKKGWDAETLKEEEDGRELYKLYYATRKQSSKFLENLSLTECQDNEDNVDYYHMSNAYCFVDEWIKNQGKQINLNYGKGKSLSEVRDTLFRLLNRSRDENAQSVQVLWYELQETGDGKNVISEFKKINTGKIKLTDAELVKGLFLLKRNFYSDSQLSKQSQLALEWEYIENTLHQSSFWNFLQTRETDRTNRIDLIFSLAYKIEKLKGLDEGDWDKKMKEIDKSMQDPRQSVVFRYYYNLFEGKTGEELQNSIITSWEDVMNIFRLLDDWFNTPTLYNYIGLLSQCGEDVTRLIVHYNLMSEKSNKYDFEKYLISRIQHYLSGIELKDNKIQLSYSSRTRKDIFNLLLTLNVHLLNEQNKKNKNELEMLRFPFEIFNAQKWDIEHIDSYKTNLLKSTEDKQNWIATAISDLVLSEEDRARVDSYVNEKQYDTAISLLKELAQESDLEDEEKNHIGNLTLLDSQTNRMYGNSLFCTKRKVVIDRITNGVFVPIGTQYIFSKFFDETGTNRSLWTKKDMNAYHEYIIGKLSTYITKCH